MYILAQDFSANVCAPDPGFVYVNPVCVGEFSVYWYDQLHLKVLVLDLLLMYKKRFKSENISVLPLNKQVLLHFSLILNDCDFFQYLDSQLFYL